MLMSADVVDGKGIAEEFLLPAPCSFTGGGFAIAGLFYPVTGPAKDYQKNNENSKLFADSFCRRAFPFKDGQADARESATTAGMAMILDHLSVFSSELISCVNFLRSPFNWMFTSACFFLEVLGFRSVARGKG